MECVRGWVLKAESSLITCTPLLKSGSNQKKKAKGGGRCFSQIARKHKNIVNILTLFVIILFKAPPSSV